MFGGRTTNGGSQYEQTAQATYRWKSTKQKFVAWDKDSQSEIEMPEGAILVPLTATNQVTGTKERDHGKATQRFNNVSSNEFTDFNTDHIKVVEYDKLDSTRNVIAEGTYSADIKGVIADMGSVARFTKNIYCLMDGEVVKLALRGASLTPWIKFENTLRETQIPLMHGHGFNVSGVSAQQNGSVSYTSPEFEITDIDEETEEIANQKAIEVEEAILHNKQHNGTSEAPVEFTPQVSEPEDKAEKTADDKEQITLDEIPF